MTRATDSTTAQWELSDYDSASNVSVNATGIETTENVTESGSGTTNTTIPVDAAGNREPTGPNGEPALTVSGVSDPSWTGNVNLDQWSSKTVSLDRPGAVDTVSEVSLDGGISLFSEANEYADVQVFVNGVDMDQRFIDKDLCCF
jgi:hypothetical protein